MNLSQVTRMREDEARQYLEKIRWPDGPVCVHCGSQDITRIRGDSARPGLLQCRDCKGQFTVTVGTIFEDSHIPLRSWVIAFHLMCSSKKGISALQLQRELGLGSYKSAWFMAHRIRHAMKSEPLKSMLKGKVEVDEAYVGGKTRKGIRGRGSERKTPVVALVERGGGVRAQVVEHVDGKTLKGAIRDMVDRDSTIMTDELASYLGIGAEFTGGHKTVCHSKGEYVKGEAHVNTAESYFALLKRGVYGVFHHVSRKHLPKYCDEFSFRWDRRTTTDGERTADALMCAEGKRLMYRNPVDLQ